MKAGAAGGASDAPKWGSTAAAAAARSTPLQQQPPADEGVPASAAFSASSKEEAENNFVARSTFCVNFIFYSTLLIAGVFVGLLYYLPPTHWLHAEVKQFLEFVSSVSVPSEGFKAGRYLKEAALLLRQWGLKQAAARVAAAAKLKHLDAALLVSFSVLSLLLVTLLIKGMFNYTKEREVEVTPPPVSYCQNRMTLEEYEDKSTTYAAVAELMASPEFKALKAQRASQGSEAWNWQRRGETETEDIEEASEEETRN